MLQGARYPNWREADMDTYARMTHDQRAKVIKLLLDSQKEFLNAVEEINDAQWNFRPSPLEWSVGWVAEHIVLTQDAIFSIIGKSLAQTPNPDWESKTAGKEEVLERVLPNRTGRAQAPVAVRPSGKLKRDEIIKQFKQSRSKILEFAERTTLPLKAHTYDNPFSIFNTLNAYDWLLYIPLHTNRHNKQMAAVKASAGYPK
jgi:DinB superfamily